MQWSVVLTFQGQLDILIERLYLKLQPHYTLSFKVTETQPLVGNFQIGEKMHNFDISFLHCDRDHWICS